MLLIEVFTLKNFVYRLNFSIPDLSLLAINQMIKAATN